MSDYSELKRLIEQGSLPTIVSTLLAEALRAEKNDLVAYNAAIEKQTELRREIEELNADLRSAAIGRDQLKTELERSQRMLLAAAMDMGAIGNALNADMNSDGEELLSMVVDMQSDLEEAQADLEKEKTISKGWHENWNGVTAQRDALKTECEGLRVDADLFRHLMFNRVEWTRNGKDDDSVTFTFGPYPSHKLRETLGADMHKGEQS